MLRSALRCAATALLLAGCERAPDPAPCPGEPQLRVQLRGTLVEGAACAAAAGVSAELALAAVVSYPGPAEAALCPERGLAEPLLGAREGDALDVTAPPRPAALDGCACDLRVAERIRGAVLREGAGGAVGFAGELVDDLAPAGGLPACAAADGEVCLAPCRIRWQLAAP